MEKKIVESISHTEIRNVLLKHGIEWRHSKTLFGKNRNTNLRFKKSASRSSRITHQKVQYFYFRMKKDRRFPKLMVALLGVWYSLR